MSFLDVAKEIFPEIREVRRFLHSIPETGCTLPKTTAFIKERLNAIGCEYTEPVENNLVVVMGQGEKTILVRADTDALPVQELSDLPFASTNGNCHCCGHDIHTSAMLGAIQILKKHEDRLCGKIKFVFQADEERILGAKRLIEAGVMENPHVDAVIGMHTAVNLKTGLLNADSGGYLASSDIFRITVSGKATHGSMPELGVDPIFIASKIVNEVQSITTRLVNAFYPIVITFGSIHGGDAANIIPDKCVLEGTVRAFDPEYRVYVKEKLADIASSVAETYGASADFCVLSETPVTYNNEELTAKMLQYAAELLGTQCVRQGSLMLKASDDFAFYTEMVPGFMYHIGMGDKSEGYIYPLHNPKVVFNEDALIQSVACYAYLPFRWLQDNK